MENQRYKERRHREAVVEEADEPTEREDLSVATPDVVLQRGDADLTDDHRAGKRQHEI